MYFHKIHHPLNFVFARRYRRQERKLDVNGRHYGVRIRDLGEDVFKLEVKHRRWRQYSQAVLTEHFSAGGTCRLTLNARGRLQLKDAQGQMRLSTGPDGGFGVCGRAWLWKLAYDPAMHFYGMGEKALGFELSGQRTQCWNTDLWADFHGHRIVHESCDPLYISIPYLIIEQRGFYVGVLVNNPFAVFMATNPDLMIAEQNAADEKPDDDFYLGAPDGAPSLYVLVGPSLAALTRKLQRLCGTVPRPPLWALGHHQSRWGYRSADELEKLADRLQAEQFPCSALWLDIDYMRGYRVFSWHPDYFKHVRADLARISKRGYRVLPIIDPGVKIDPQYAVYCDGLKKDVFCRNSAGTPYTGFVWPGATAFPDFSLPRVREWWAEKVARFARDGIQGVWIDMNDPSTGASDADEMRFNHGKNAHATYHNQYALGMAAATREGLQRAHPEQRPFVLSRSGFISMSRFAAVWNGDNFSNEHHLQQSIPMSLNLALSGLPFNGPDVPGFCGNADGPLLSLWYRAGFLFPFFRNHAAWDSARQEPWAFGKSYLRVARHYTRLRYKLLPYMYNLFIAQEERGEAIMRPMLYDFRSTRKLPLEHTADQFMLGPYLLHAPLLQRDARQREVTLPHGMWFDAMCGRWIKGGRRIRVTVAKEATPIFVRDGAVIPMQRGRPKNGEVDMAAIEMHVFLSPRFRGEASVRYRFDDGETTAYQQGAETDVTFRLLGRGNVLDIKIDEARMDYRPCQVRWVMYRHVESVRLNRNGKMQKLRVRPYQWRFSGRALSGLQAE